MRPRPKARVRPAECGAPTQITASQFAALSALPDPVQPVPPSLVCELADGHEDDHVAFAVASDGGDQWWWVRWGGQRHEIVQIDLCEVTEPGAPDPEFCL